MTSRARRSEPTKGRAVLRQAVEQASQPDADADAAAAFAERLQREANRASPKGSYKGRAKPGIIERINATNDRLPEVIDYLLWFKRMTHQELADDLGMSIHTFRDRIKGRTKISLGEAEALAFLLDVDIRALTDPAFPLYQQATRQPTKPASALAASHSNARPQMTTEGENAGENACYPLLKPGSTTTMGGISPGQTVIPARASTRCTTQAYDAPAKQAQRTTAGASGWVAGQPMNTRKGR